ncbi:MAG: LysM peptidoglycan-binding domain-containing protein, partial [Phycisphaeraceae bacterium]|nr:LysM peptidoglycan-binding domain-containing protein [Phycisphaeraceae bacterium]
SRGLSEAKPRIEDTQRPGPFDHLQNKPAPTATPTTTQPVARPAPVTSYTIKAGDTFSSIAADKLGDEKYWQQIAQANPTVDPQKLKVGQVIRLPTPGSSAASSTASAAGSSSDSTSSGKPAYVVKAGDTLSSIADQYYGDRGLWSTIYSANKTKIGSNPDKLKAGMELTIPPAPKGAE